MKCQYRNDGNEATYEAIREVVPDGFLGSSMTKIWHGMLCEACLERLKRIKHYLPKSKIQFRPRHTREDFKTL
jgi:hypothetical protein